MSMSCIRYVFCAINFLLWLIGCGLLGLGLWIHFGAFSATHHPWAAANLLLIIVGACVFLISFFGCCGACFQSKCMIVTYLVLVVKMFLIELALATLVFVYRQEINDQLNDGFTSGIQNHYNMPTGKGLKEIWDMIHSNLNCCGLKGYEDWYDINAWPGRKMVPESCCLPTFNNNSDCWNEGNQDKWYSVGCSDRIQMWMVNQLHLVGIVGLLMAFIQLFGLVSAMLLCCTNSSHKRSKGHIYHQPK